MKKINLKWCALGILVACVPGSTFVYRVLHPLTPIVINYVPETAPVEIVPMAKLQKPSEQASARNAIVAKPKRDAVKIMRSIGRNVRAMKTKTKGGAQ